MANRVRLYSTKSFKSLGTLSYHTKSCQSLAFAHLTVTNRKVRSNIIGDYSSSSARVDANNDDAELTEDERVARSKWLACGSQDNRVSVWELMSFERSQSSKDG
jgi:hypothetical protein